MYDIEDSRLHQETRNEQLEFKKIQNEMAVEMQIEGRETWRREPRTRGRLGSSSLGWGRPASRPSSPAGAAAAARGARSLRWSGYGSGGPILSGTVVDP